MDRSCRKHSRHWSTTLILSLSLFLSLFRSLYKRAIGSDIIERRRLRVRLSKKKKWGGARTCSLFDLTRFLSTALINAIDWNSYGFDELRFWHSLSLAWLPDSRMWYFLYSYTKYNILEIFINLSVNQISLLFGNNNHYERWDRKSEKNKTWRNFIGFNSDLLALVSRLSRLFIGTHTRFLLIRNNGNSFKTLRRRFHLGSFSKSSGSSFETCLFFEEMLFQYIVSIKNLDYL